MIKTLDIQKFLAGSSQDKKHFAKNLGQCFEEIGFVVLNNHGISATQQDEAYRVISDFFALPVAQKKKYEIEGIGGIRGYTAFGKEHAKDSKVGDLKEFFHIGMTLPKGHRFEKHSDYHPNISVAEVADFNVTLLKLYADLNYLALKVLSAIAIYLDLPEDYFQEKVRYGNSVLRSIYYPPLSGTEEHKAIRAGAHEDINLITLLIGASYPGLQVVARNGEWIPITAKKSEIVVNVGDMMQRLTNYQFVSTTHRVVNPPPTGKKEDARYSVPFFVHPDSDMNLASLPQCVTKEKPAKDLPILAGDYLNQRLRENGLFTKK